MDDLKQLFALPDEFEEGEEELVWCDPIYETLPDSLAQHWIFSIPSKGLQKGRWKGFALMQVLRLAEPQREWGEGEVQQIQSLSDTMTHLRKSLLENPMQSDIKQFLLYLALLKRVGRYFHNNASPFDCPFSQSREEGCSLFLYEYINFTLFALQKHYHSMIRVLSTFVGPAYSQQHFQSITICLGLLEEVRQKVYQVLAHQDGVGDKWEYKTSPVAIGSNDNIQKMMKSMHIQENEHIREYVRLALGGDESLQTRISLLQIKKNEVRVAILLESIATLGPEEKSVALYERIVPLMRNITKSYELVIKKHEYLNNYLVQYTQFMSFYWVILGDYKLAEVDWQCYNLEKYLDFDTAGNRALKRLEVALYQIDAREKRLFSQDSLQTDFGLEKIYDGLKKDMRSLENTIRPIIQTKLGYKSASIFLRPIEQKHPDSTNAISADTLLETIYQQQPLCVEVFQLLERIKLGSPSPSTTEPKVQYIPEESHTRAQLVDDRDVLEERRGFLEFLLDRKDRRGEVVLNTKRVRELEVEYQKVLEKFAQEGGKL